jgi:hypothetical protein
MHGSAMQCCIWAILSQQETSKYNCRRGIDATKLKNTKLGTLHYFAKVITCADHAIGSAPSPRRHSDCHALSPDGVFDHRR